MSEGLRLALRVPTERFEVAVEWESDEPARGLFGPSGSGKTTVLEALAGLRSGVRGRIEVAGRTWLDSARGICLPPEERGVGYVPQELLLFPHLDVRGNLAVGARRARRATRRLDPERVLAVLELAPLADRPVGALSGGERQRVALGRALCSAPDLLLLDEPLASLDQPLRRRILPYLLRVREELAIPTIHVSHDPAEMLLLARDLLVLDAGRVTRRGTPEQVFSGQPLAGDGSEAVVNVLRGTVEAVRESLATVVIAPGLAVAVPDEGGIAPGQRVAHELRGSDVMLARGSTDRLALSAQNVLPAIVRSVHPPAGGDPHAAVVVVAELAAGGQRLAVVVSQRACRELEIAPGLPIHLVFKAQTCRLLASELGTARG